MDGTFDAQMKDLDKVITNGQHLIPKYQRRYSWEENNIRDFWNDIVSSPKQSHFLGSMVVARLIDGDTLEVVDGQQRLTTAIVLLSALRDRFNDLNFDSLEDGIKRYIVYIDRNGEERFRLRNVDESANNRLVDNVLNPASRVSVNVDEALRERVAYRIFAGLLDEVVSKAADPKAELVEIRDRLLSARVVYVEVNDRKSAFTIFETLNDRGMDLGVSDLVKTLLLSKVADSADREGERLWSEMVDRVESAGVEGIGIDEFLYYFWNSKAPDGKPSSEEITNVRIRRSIQEYIEKAGEANEVEERTKDLLVELSSSARVFEALGATLLSRGSADPWRGVDKSWREDKWSKIGAELYGILVTGSNQPLVLLLSLIRRYTEPAAYRMRSALLLKFLKAIRVFQVRWSIAQKGSTSTQRSLYRRTATLIDSADSAQALADALEYFKDRANAHMATDNQFKSGLEKLVYSNTRMKDGPRVRYILSEVERALGDSKLDFGRPLSIEHLEGQGAKSENTPRNSWVFKLGNLLLLDPDVNSTLPQEFSEKSDEFRKWINPNDTVLEDALKTGEWGAQVANERLAWIEEHALSIWPNQIG